MARKPEFNVLCPISSEKTCQDLRTMSARLSAFAALNNSDSESEGEAADFENPRSNSQQDSLNVGSMAIDLGLGTGSTLYSNPSETQFTPLFHSSHAELETKSKYDADGNRIVGLLPDNLLVIKGQYKLKVLLGTITIDSYWMDVNSKELIINASNLTSLPCIRCPRGEISSYPHFNHEPVTAVIQIANYYNGMDKFPSLYPHLKNLYTIENPRNSMQFTDTYTILTHPEQNTFATSISETWQSLLYNLSSNLNNGILLCIGNKNSGKSTLVKLLANSILSKPNNIDKLQIMDIDPGQPELCLPGSISLSTIKSPLLGTIQPFTEENLETITKFIGFTAPNIQPLNYLHQLNELIKIVESNNLKNKNTITLINCPGWVKGFGAEIISNLNQRLELSYLIQLSEELKDLDIIREISWNSKIKIIKLPSINKLSYSSNLYSPSVIRNFKLLSYMHYNFTSKTFDFNPLIYKSPYRISYSTSTDINKLENFNGIIGVSIYDSQGLLVSDIFQLLECQYMAIFTITKNSLQNSFKSQDFKSGNNTSPNLIQDNKIQNLQSSELNFYGYSIIHSVDTTDKTVNLYTPINVATLSKKLMSNDEKLILIKGKQEVPMDEIYSTQLVKGNARYWDNFGLKCPPYVSESLSSEVVGGKTVSIRRNIQRR